MGLFDFIGPASGLLFTLENIIWINLGVFIGCVFAAIPGLSVILCIILFLPVTYTMKAIPGMMFLLGIYCAGGYGGSVSAILINTRARPTRRLLCWTVIHCPRWAAPRRLLKSRCMPPPSVASSLHWCCSSSARRWPKFRHSWARRSTSWSACSA